MNLKELFEIVFKEAYSMGKQDGLEGIHIRQDVIFERFLSDWCNQAETRQLLVSLQKRHESLLQDNLH